MSVSYSGNILHVPCDTSHNHLDNCAYDYFQRIGGHIIEEDIQVTGTGAITSNVLQFTGTVLVKV